jgi:uncharacterized membrane protein
MKVKFAFKTLLILLVALMLSSCADKVVIDSCVEAERAGFWNGLWHGLISPLAFMVSIFDDEVAIYAACNKGVWYDLGFLIGIGAVLGSGSRAV